MNEQELNKKLAKWAGFTLEEVQACSCHPDRKRRWWNYPKGSFYDNDVPSFTESLDACFKWLVPKFPRDRVISFGNGWCEITNSGSDGWGTLEIYGAGEAETPALALCLAIEKLIDGKDD